MHPETMKHKASLWEGEVGTSNHITDVHWEGDISQDALREVADQISNLWQTIDLELDPTHPRHGQTFRLHRDLAALVSAAELQFLQETEDELDGQYVWVHCCQHGFDPAGEHEDDQGRAFRQVFSTMMFCAEFTSFEDIADQCDAHFGKNGWDEYELYLDDDLPVPTATFTPY